jgi:hypothetical protein
LRSSGLFHSKTSTFLTYAARNSKGVAARGLKLYKHVYQHGNLPTHFGLDFFQHKHSYGAFFNNKELVELLSLVILKVLLLKGTESYQTY